MLYVNITPKGETEGLLAFMSSLLHIGAQLLMACTKMPRHQDQQRTLSLAQEHFWWPKMDEDCRALVRGCQCCKIFEGAVVKAAAMPHSGIHTSRTGSCRLHQHRDHHGAQTATKHQKYFGPHQINSQDMQWHSSPRIRKRKPSCEFFMSDSSQ